MKEVFAAIFLVLGAFFMFVAALGIYRFPDLFSRMHAAAKASSFGTGLLLTAFIIVYFKWYLVIEAALIVFFVFITTPVATQMIGRAGYWLGVPLYEKTKIDPAAAAFIRTPKAEGAIVQGDSEQL